MQLARLLLIAAIPALLSAQDPDPKEIIIRAIQADARNEQASRNYTYIQREERRTLDGSNRVKDRKIETFDVTLLEGSPFRRLIARNDQPLPPDEKRKQDERLQNSIESRSKETDLVRQQRIANWNSRRAQQREALKEIPEAFDFRISGEDTISGQPVWVIEGLPRKGFKGVSKMARAILPNVRGHFWISRKDYGWARIEMEAIDTVSIGLLLFRMSPGSRIEMEQTYVNDEVWLPKRIAVYANARILLVKGMHVQMFYDDSDYRKFSTDSQVVSTGGN